ncbi:phytanoyl-CoA dioxygenase family protein [Novosphingobium sp. ERN07]|uniref:phytanoyl-CoA dioxygenase family protein n=1 Tax=Novosphingobium sp. ERN07 TaxID=2726187 RepID=UPI0014566D2B|nr:phytanoyl-CoA dioxygenase family protein [Novosphingobium sp. ERN07]NLR72523.1 phytanoyl-CoA dioxygenase family protein [Novosphingobium sp. ERN07]
MKPEHPIFPGVPLVESPIFSAEIDRMQLDDREKEIAIALNRDGYVVIDFPDPDLDGRIDRIRADLAPQLGIDDSDHSSIKQGGIGRIQDAWKTQPDVKAIAANPVILDLLSRLYGRSAFPFQTLNFPVGTQQDLHTDSVHFSSVPPRFMCGVWLAMEDIHDDAGPLNYVPGSHKWPMMDNCMIGRRGADSRPESAQLPFHDAWAALISVQNAPTERFLARKGQALIWCANLLHGGSVQTDPRRTRWSQVTHYYFDDCVYYTPAHSDEYLGRLDLRQIVSIADMTSKPNIYQGAAVSDPKSVRPPLRNALPHRLRRGITGLISRITGG